MSVCLSLYMLWISSANSIGDEGAKALEEAVRINTALQRLHIGGEDEAQGPCSG